MMNIKERVLSNFINEKAMEMRNTVLRNINKDLENRIKSNCPNQQLKELLELRDKLMQLNLEEFLEMEFDAALQDYMWDYGSNTEGPKNKLKMNVNISDSKELVDRVIERIMEAQQRTP